MVKSAKMQAEKNKIGRIMHIDRAYQKGFNDRKRRAGCARGLISGMKRFLALAIPLCISSALAANLPLPPDLIDLQSPQGQALFLQSTDRQAYWPLSAAFQTQENQAFCGVASLVMILNSLPVPAPVSPANAPYRYFTQDDLFPSGGTNFLDGDWIAHHGLTLDQFGALGAHFGLGARVVHMKSGGLARFRKEIVQALTTPEEFVAVNFWRPALGEQGYGHISPLAAYDSHTDRFLLLDVARYKYPPAWVKAADLYSAADTVDKTSNDTRGYVVFSMPAR